MNRIAWLASVTLPLLFCACGGAHGSTSGTTGQDLSGSNEDDGGEVETQHGGGHDNKADGAPDLDDRDDRDAEAEHEDGEAHGEDADRGHDDQADAGEDHDHGGPGPH